MQLIVKILMSQTTKDMGVKRWLPNVSVQADLGFSSPPKTTPAQVAHPPVSAKSRLTQLLEQFGLEDEADELACNGIKSQTDLSYLDENVMKKIRFSPVSKAKLKRLKKYWENLQIQDFKPSKKDVMIADTGNPTKGFDSGDIAQDYP